MVADMMRKSDVILEYPTSGRDIGEILKMYVYGYYGTDAGVGGKDVQFDDLDVEDGNAIVEALRSARKTHGKRFDTKFEALISMLDIDNEGRGIRERDRLIRIKHIVFRMTYEEIAEEGQPSRKEREEDDGTITHMLSAQSIGEIVRKTPIHNRRALESYRLELAIRLQWASRRGKADYKRFCGVWPLSKKQQRRLKDFFRHRYKCEEDRIEIVDKWERFHDDDDLFKPGFDHYAQPIEKLYGQTEAATKK